MVFNATFNNISVISWQSILLVQFANLFRNGEKVAMSTRSGSFVTLEELREEVGNDAAR
jgi:arginyl-tRNA synthetase